MKMSSLEFGIRQSLINNLNIVSASASGESKERMCTTTKTVFSFFLV